MYLERIMSFITGLYQAYPLYVAAAMLALLLLSFFRPKMMAKCAGLLLALIVCLYIAGLIMQGVSSSSGQKKSLTEKSRAYSD